MAIIRHSRAALFPLLAATGLLSISVGSCAIEPGGFTSGEIHKLTRCFYFENQTEPCATFRAGRIYKDYEHRGFFKIGALPLIAIDNVTVELPKSLLAAEGISQVQAWLKTQVHGSSRVELRHVRLQTGASPENFLECERIKLTGAAHWDLLDHVTIHLGTNTIHSVHASLCVGGAQIGRLSFAETTLPSLDLFPTNQTAVNPDLNP